MTTITHAALDDRLVEAAIGALELYSIHLGRTLGTYDALTSPRTVKELAKEAGIAERYAREWLEQQAVAGFVDVDDSTAPWARRRYSMNDAQRALLTEADDPTHVSPLADMVAGVGGVLDRVAQAYRSGEGVPYAAYGPTFRAGQGGVNRPAFTHDLVGPWLDAIPDVAARLRTEGGAVADLGCGTGWSTIALAQAFPAATVVGYDTDEASIADARRNARTAGERARFEHADAAGDTDHGPFDLIVVLEALHDMADPVDALRVARSRLTAAGAVLIADEKVAEEFHAPGDELERMMYGWSVVHCLPASLAEQDSAAIGTVLRPPMVHVMAEEAGFGSVERPEIDAGFFNLYVLRR